LRKLAIVILLSIVSCQSRTKNTSANSDWTALWNGKDFSGWHYYFGDAYKDDWDTLSLYGRGPSAIDKDPLGILKIAETENGNAIRITGEAWGMLYTEDDFHNYHLKLKMKWGEAKYPPRVNEPRDSGLLYHGFGEVGSAYVWMNCQELQILEGHFGDYVPLGDVAIDVPSVPSDSLFYKYQENAKRRKYYFAEFSDRSWEDTLAKRYVYKDYDAEKPHGEWNDIELITLGDSCIYVVNGKVVMRLFNSRTMNEGMPLKSGKIMLQSESAEVFYKDIYIKSINEIPEVFK